MYVVAKLEAEKCTGCKMCIFTCPDPNVLKYIAADKKVEVDEKRCKGCGLCAEICTKGALAVNSL